MIGDDAPPQLHAALAAMNRRFACGGAGGWLRVGQVHPCVRKAITM